MRNASANSLPNVAIAGCGAISAVGYGVNALKSALLTNASGLQSCARFDSPRFQSSVVGAAPSNEADTFTDDPAYRLADEALRQVREQSRDLLQSISPDRLGLVLSTTKANIEAMERLADQRACSEAARRHLQGDLWRPTWLRRTARRGRSNASRSRAFPDWWRFGKVSN
jgi:3-oxoacyl-(acyl-carrier-protein) synthase